MIFNVFSLFLFCQRFMIFLLQNVQWKYREKHEALYNYRN